MENIRYGRLDATDEVSPLRSWPNMDSFIRRLPEGYDTMLTNSGSNLSQEPELSSCRSRAPP